jgi:hypothetical protein
MALPRPGAFEARRDSPARGSDAPGIGHNSAAATGPLSPEALAERAASIHAAHVATRRKSLTAFLIPARPAGKAPPDPKSN